MKKIYVIEDEIYLKEAIESKLTRNGFLVTSENPDLYLFDLWVDSVPRWDRLEALRESTNALIIVFTAYSLNEYKDKAMKLWADWFINKPIAPDDLISYIKTRLVII